MSEVVLLAPAVENLIFQVQVRHEQNVDRLARAFLHKAGEQDGVRVLAEIEIAELGTVRSLSALIVYKLKKQLLATRTWASPSRPARDEVAESLMANSSCSGDEFSEATLLEIERIMKGCEVPGMSDGLSDAALLALPLVNATSTARPCVINNVDALSDDELLRMDIPGHVAGSVGCAQSESVGGGCRSYGFSPTGSAPPLVASQGSNDSVNAGPLLCSWEPECTPSSHSSDPMGSPMKRSIGTSFDDGSFARSVKPKQAEKQKSLTGYFKQTRPFLDPPHSCPAAPADRVWGRGTDQFARKLEFDGDAARTLDFAHVPMLEFGDGRCKLEFGDAPRKLDFASACQELEFGDEPTTLDPQSAASGLVPKLDSDLLQENHVRVKPECVFRHKECAHHRISEVPDLEGARVYGELSFTKRFLILDHLKDGQAFPSLPELEKFKHLEVSVVDNRLFHAFTHPDHFSMRDWSKLGKGHHLVYTCYVSHSGKCEFTGPRFENGGTPLHRAFGEDNVLVVKFEDTTKNNHTILDRYRCLARHGIHCGLKRFFFYAFKDAESKKKQGVSKKNSYGCKAFFVAISSSAPADTTDKLKAFQSIAKARNYVMHPTVPTLAKAISRLQLALSQTTQIPLDFSEVHIKRVKDIACEDKEGNEVRDANGNLLIHTDGCGSISKNLAKLCQQEVVKGIEQTDSMDKQEYPLMMQVRLFYEGNLWKGVLVVDLKLPDNTIEVRPSMLKVERDETLCTETFNSLELCNTSRKPSDARLFQHLILLLTMGGVKEEVLLKYVETCMEKLRGYLTSTKEALKVAVRNLDSHHSATLACEMLLTGMDPSQEPFLQKVISEMIRYEIKNYSLGKVPVRDTSYLMGCADPTGLLERNQVVILVGNGTRICREKVLVYKPPGLHPGDVHVFEATWVKQIEAHIGTATYGIIFSTKGARSVTDEMAGSDLDGDQYWVSWNPELVDSFTPSPPWEAPTVIDEKKPVLRPPTEVEFETVHFEKFLQTKFDPSMIKGRAANSWLALTDHAMSVPGDNRVKEQILTLVNLFYESLDAEKSGKEIRWPTHINITRFPHYLEKKKDSEDASKPRPASIHLLARQQTPKSFDVYKSKSILGKIYDSVRNEDLDKPVSVDVDKVYEYEGYLDYYDLWQHHVNEYGKRTSSVLNAVSLVDQEFRSCACDKVLAEYKKKFLGEPGEKASEQLLKEASAIYTAVYSKAVIKESLSLQFAWKVAGSQLCKIRAEKQQGAGTSYNCISTDILHFLLRR